MFSERLYRTFSGSAIVDVNYLLKLSAYLHDLGKASKHYYHMAGILQEGEPLSFWLHHVVSSLILQTSHLLRTDKVLQYSSYIVLRHHQAMRSTLEVRIGIGEKEASHIYQVVKGMNTNWVEKILDTGVAKGFIESSHSKIVLKAVEALGMRSDEKSITSLVDAVVRNSGILDPGSRRLVISVAGALIIADNVISSFNRGGDNLLVDMWMRELPKLRSEAERCISEARNALPI
jgi:CRISPR/Cas system-associated endonuclease Cas3-HD